MKLKGKQGTFYRAMLEDDKVVKEIKKAYIYEGVFAVYKDDVGTWHMDHVGTGYSVAKGERKKDCVAQVQALLAIPINWDVDSKDAIYDEMKASPGFMTNYLEAIHLAAE